MVCHHEEAGCKSVVTRRTTAATFIVLPRHLLWRNIFNVVRSTFLIWLFLVLL